MRSTPPRPRRLICTRVPSAARSFSSAARVLGSRRGAARRGGRAQQGHPALHLAHGEARAGPPRGPAPAGPRRRSRASSARAWPASSCPPSISARISRGQAQQAQGVGDRGAVLAHLARHLLLGEAELLLQPLVGLGLLERRAAPRAGCSRPGPAPGAGRRGRRAPRSGTRSRPSLLGGAPAPLARDDLVAVARAGAPGSAAPCRSRGWSAASSASASGSIAVRGW